MKIKDSDYVLRVLYDYSVLDTLVFKTKKDAVSYLEFTQNKSIGAADDKYKFELTTTKTTCKECNTTETFNVALPKKFTNIKIYPDSKNKRLPF